MLIAPYTKMSETYSKKTNGKKIKKTYKSKETDNDRDVASIIKEQTKQPEQPEPENKSFQQELKEKYLAQQEKSHIPTETLIKEQSYKKEQTKHINNVLNIYKKQ